MLKAMGLYTSPAKITTSGPFAPRPQVTPPPGHLQQQWVRNSQKCILIRKPTWWPVACCHGIWQTGAQKLPDREGSCGLQCTKAQNTGNQLPFPKSRQPQPQARRGRLTFQVHLRAATGRRVVVETKADLCETWYLTCSLILQEKDGVSIIAEYVLPHEYDAFMGDVSLFKMTPCPIAFIAARVNEPRQTTPIGEELHAKAQAGARCKPHSSQLTLLLLADFRFLVSCTPFGSMSTRPSDARCSHASDQICRLRGKAAQVDDGVCSSPAAAPAEMSSFRALRRQSWQSHRLPMCRHVVVLQGLILPFPGNQEPSPCSSQGLYR